MNPPTRQTTAQPAPFKLNITRGVRREPPRIVLHGAPGIGKSTLASRAPSPVFLDLEHGTLQMDVSRADGIDSWEALLGALRALATEAHDFRTVVIDTLDRAEWLCWQHLCQRERVNSIELVGKGYGRGYVAAYEQFRAFAALLEALRARWRRRWGRRRRFTTRTKACRRRAATSPTRRWRKRTTTRRSASSG